MGDRATTSDCTKQKQHIRIAKLRLPTLAVAGSGSSTLKTHFHDAEPFHFELFRSEANKGSPPPPLLAALFSNDFFRIPGTANGSSRPNLVIQNNPAPDFIAKNPLVGMLAGLFSEIKQVYVVGSEAKKGSPPLLAALFSHDFFRIAGTNHRAKGSSRPNLLFQNNPAADFIAKNPLVCMLAGLFSEIKQEVDMEARKFWLTQSEYLKECMRRSRKPAAICTNNNTPPTDNNTQVLKLKNDLSFLVRLFFEIMEGWESEGIIKKAACEMPSLPDIYNNSTSSTKEPKATTTSADKSVNADVLPSSNHISGFNTLFNLASKRKY